MEEGRIVVGGDGGGGGADAGLGQRSDAPNGEFKEGTLHHTITTGNIDTAIALAVLSTTMFWVNQNR